MTVQAMRQSILDIVKDQPAPDHLGLAFLKYHPALDSGAGHAEREKVIHRLTGKPPKNADQLYRKAFERQQAILEEDKLFSRSMTLRLRDRLFIGMGGASVLEFGMTLHHVYGLPMIPGSAVKGVCAHYADEAWGDLDADWRLGAPLHRLVFGNPENEDASIPAAAGGIDFLDAWWMPDAANGPFCTEIINPHHPDYYVADHPSPPADWDSPVPVKMMAVRGSFLFALRGPAQWNDLAAALMVEALCSWGIGGKTRAGYGRFETPDSGKATKQNAEEDVWENAVLSYSPGDGILTATNADGSGKAILKGKEKAMAMAPEAYHARLFGRRRKSVVATVRVAIYGNLYNILDIR